MTLKIPLAMTLSLFITSKFIQGDWIGGAHAVLVRIASAALLDFFEALTSGP